MGPDSMASQTALQWNRAEAISVPLADRERRIAIRQADWDRIKRNLSSCTKSPSALPVWYSIFFGIGGSAGLSVYPIYVTKDLPSWVLPSYVIGTGFSIVLGCILVWVEGWMTKNRKSDVILIQEDMKDIEGTFQLVGPTPQPAAAPPPAPVAPTPDTTPPAGGAHQ